jgi:hypothetical protein
VPDKKWKSIQFFYVDYRYSWNGYSDFYQGYQKGGSGTGLSRLFFSEAEAKEKIKEWKSKYGPCTGVVHSSTYYTVKSCKVWTRGEGDASRFLLEKPDVCKCPCEHCPVVKVKGYKFIELMVKMGVRRPEFTMPELEHVCETSIDLFPERIRKS